MIYVKLEGHDFLYEVEDIIRAFLPDEEILVADSTPAAEYRGIFVFSGIKEERGQVIVTTVLWEKGEERFKERVSWGKETDSLSQVKRELKRLVKREIYTALSKALEKDLPWGTLTGIRPAKLVHEMLEKGLIGEEIHGRLKGNHKISEKKARLLYDVAMAERGFIDHSAGNKVSLYIGIPFCNTRCLYCSFPSNLIGKYGKLVGPYMEALKREIKGTARLIEDNGFEIQSIYIGGGTPTSIDGPALGGLLETVEGSLDLKNMEEYTLEAGRPDSIDEEKLRTIKRSKVTRVSINPQTMNNETLKLIGRNHRAEDIVHAFRLVREAGFDNINMDTIVGLPEEGSADFEKTMEDIFTLGPECLTVHTLAIKRASNLRGSKGRYHFPGEEEAGEMLDLAHTYSTGAGMHPYYLYRQKNILGNLENVGYCKPGYESVYNIQIMEEKQTILAVGAGAVTKVVFPHENRLERAFNVKSVEEYIRRVEEILDRKKALLE